MRSIGMQWPMMVVLLAITAPLAAQARAIAPRPSGSGARIVKGAYIPPPDGPVERHVPGDALLLRNPGGLFPELALACGSPRIRTDSGRAALRRRVDSLEVGRTRTALRGGWHFGPLEPGRYLMIAWIELRWPAAARPPATRTQVFLGVDTLTVTAHTDTGLMVFNTGHPGFKKLFGHTPAFRCLDFLVAPSAR